MGLHDTKRKPRIFFNPWVVLQMNPREFGPSRMVVRYSTMVAQYQTQAHHDGHPLLGVMVCYEQRLQSERALVLVSK